MMQEENICWDIKGGGLDILSIQNFNLEMLPNNILIYLIPTYSSCVWFIVHQNYRLV